CTTRRARGRECPSVYRAIAAALRSGRSAPIVVAVVGVLARGEVVHVGGVVVLLLHPPILVGVVQAADGAFLDRAARTAVGFLARGLALVLRRRVRPEVPRTRGGAGPATAFSRPWREASRSGPAESAARGRTPRTRRAEATRPWARR